MHVGEEDHAWSGWTTSRRGQDSPWKSQSEWQRTDMNGESMSMVWPTLGSRTAKEQNWSGPISYWMYVSFGRAQLTRVRNTNGIWIDWAVSAALTAVSNRHTRRHQTEKWDFPPQRSQLLKETHDLHHRNLKTALFQSSYSSPQCPAVWQTATFNTVRCPCNGLVREVSP